MSSTVHINTSRNLTTAIVEQEVDKYTLPTLDTRVDKMVLLPQVNDSLTANVPPMMLALPPPHKERKIIIRDDSIICSITTMSSWMDHVGVTIENTEMAMANINEKCRAMKIVL